MTPKPTKPKQRVDRGPSANPYARTPAADLEAAQKRQVTSAEAAAAAIEMLARAMTESEGSIEESNRKIKGAASGGDNAALKTVAAPLTMLVRQFALVLGPLAIMGALIQSNATGFQLLGSAIKVLVATLGPLLLPVLAVFAAAIIELSDKLWGEIAPALEKWYTFIVENVLPALRMFVDAIMWVVKALPGFAKGVEKAKDATVDVTSGAVAEDMFGAIASLFESDKPGEFKSDLASRFDRRGAAAPGESGDSSKSVLGFDTAKIRTAAAPSVMDVMTGRATPAEAGGGAAGGKPGALADVVRELRNSIGPRAQFASLSQVSKNAQLAALNASPIEQRMLERLTKSVETLEKVEVNTRRKGGLGE